jgi:hypothetical protein
MARESLPYFEVAQRQDALGVCGRNASIDHERQFQEGEAMTDMSDLDDAIVEDTIHCTCCGYPFTLGASEPYVIIDPPRSDPPFNEQVKLCGGCAEKVAKAYQDALRDAGVCGHGVADGEYCEPCNKEYKRARKESGDET